MNSARSCDSEDIVLSTAFHKFEVSDDLQDRLRKVGGLSILPFLLDGRDKVGVFAADVHEHSCLEVRLGAAACVG